MACFLVPAAEAIVVTGFAVAAKIKENKQKAQEFTYTAKSGELETGEKVSLSRKLSWLAYLLFGGCILLAFEHIWHGEVVPWYPFLTAASNPQDTAEMLLEMSTVGVTMAVIVTAVWGIMVFASGLIEKKAIKSAQADA